MPASRDKNDKYGTDPYGIIRRGPPGGESANFSPSISVGKVGTSVPSAVSGGKSMGSGVGITVKSPFTKAKGGPVKKPGLYANINAKRERIADGSGEKMRKPGSKGAPTKDAFKQSTKTASSGGISVKEYGDIIKKASGGNVQTSSDTARKLATEMGGMACGGKPVKKARGGAGKVRKGMMSPEGTILQAVKPKKGVM